MQNSHFCIQKNKKKETRPHKKRPSSVFYNINSYLFIFIFSNLKSLQIHIYDKAHTSYDNFHDYIFGYLHNLMWCVYFCMIYFYKSFHGLCVFWMVSKFCVIYFLYIFIRFYLKYQININLRRKIEITVSFCNLCDFSVSVI